MVKRPRRKRRTFIPQTDSIVSNEIFIPNHSGMLDAGKVHRVPTDDLDPVNKKYVDDEIVSNAWLQAVNQTGLTGDKAGSFDLSTTATIQAEQLTSTDDITMLGHLMTLGDGSGTNIVMNFNAFDISGNLTFNQTAGVFEFDKAIDVDGKTTTKGLDSIGGNILINNNAAGTGGVVDLDVPFDKAGFFRFKNDGKNSWRLINNASTQIFGLRRFDNDGNSLGDVYNISKSTGEMSFNEGFTFVGEGSGLPYANLSATDNTTETVIATAGTAVQVLIFDTNGPNNNMTPDHTNDHITVVKAGDYKLTCSVTLNSVVGAGSRVQLTGQKNNGASLLTGIHSDRNVGGGGVESGAMTMSGIVTLAVNDTIEVWVENETNTQNYVVEDISLSLEQVGG